MASFVSTPLTGTPPGIASASSKRTCGSRTAAARRSRSVHMNLAGALDQENPNRALYIAAGVVTGTLPSSVTMPDLRKLTHRLTEIEISQKRAKAKSDPTKLTAGQWRVCVIGPKPQTRRALFFGDPYVFPLRVQQIISFPQGPASTGEFNNGVFLGPLSFRLKGPARWVPKRNRLEFTFSTAELKLGPLGPLEWKVGEDSLDGLTLKELPFFTFFMVDDTIAVSRGRSGGLALYGKVPAGAEL